MQSSTPGPHQESSDNNKSAQAQPENNPDPRVPLPPLAPPASSTPARDSLIQAENTRILISPPSPTPPSPTLPSPTPPSPTLPSPTLPNPPPPSPTLPNPTPPSPTLPGHLTPGIPTPEHLPASSTEAVWKVPAIVFAGIALVLLFALLFTYQQGKDWEEEANELEQQNNTLQNNLTDSEVDVSNLEKRQTELAAEKASIEDERKELQILASVLAEAMFASQECSINLNKVIAILFESRESAYLPSGPAVEKTLDETIESCEKADELFESIMAKVELAE